jgi:hypothetical protein
MDHPGSIRRRASTSGKAGWFEDKVQTLFDQSGRDARIAVGPDPPLPQRVPGFLSTRFRSGPLTSSIGGERGSLPGCCSAFRCSRPLGSNGEPLITMESGVLDSATSAWLWRSPRSVPPSGVETKTAFSGPSRVRAMAPAEATDHRNHRLPKRRFSIPLHPFRVARKKTARRQPLLVVTATDGRSSLKDVVLSSSFSSRSEQTNARGRTRRSVGECRRCRCADPSLGGI